MFLYVSAVVTCSKTGFADVLQLQMCWSIGWQKMRALSSDCFYYGSKIGSHQLRVRRTGKSTGCLKKKVIAVKLSPWRGGDSIDEKIW